MVRTNYMIFGKLVIILTATSAVWAVDKEWNLAGNGMWNSALNWSPNGVPTLADSVFLGRAPFPQGFLTTLDVDATVANLTLRNASDLKTAGFQMYVNGITTVGGSGSVLTIDPRSTGDMDGLDTKGLVIQNDGLVSLNGGILELESGSLEILTGGVSGLGGLGGFGTIELVESGLAGAQVFDNSGRLYVGKSQFATAGLLTITTTDTNNPAVVGDGTVDLDGNTDRGVVDVDDDPFGLVSNLTLIVDAALSDTFSGEMLIGRGDAIEFRQAWSLNGDLQLNGSSGTATLRGSPLTATTGANINVNSGVGAIESNLTLLNGTINVATGTTLRLDGTSNINRADALQLNGTATLHVTGSTTINETTADFNWDGGGSTNTRVSGGGMLTVNVDNLDVGDDNFDGRIDLDDDGDLSVTVADGEWNIFSGGSLVKNNTGLSSVSGSRIVDNGSIDVHAGTLEINPALEVASGGVINVDSGATAQLDGTNDFLPGSLLLIQGTLRLNGATVWNSPALANGTGTIVNGGGATIAGDTTIGVGVFDWDAGSTTIQSGRSLTLNVDQIDVGNDTFNNQTINVNSGTLTVNVADDSWTLGSGGILTLNNSNGTQPVLNGDRVVLSNGGSIRVQNGDADVNAPVTVDSGSEILIQSPLTLQLHGPTTLNGGNINEAGGINATVGQFGAVTVTGASSINVDTYNWDQAPTTIESGGSLTLNVNAIDIQPGERYDHDLTLNSGSLTVNNLAGEWTVDERLVLNNTNGTSSRISGSKLHVGDGVGSSDANFTVGGTGASLLDTSVDYHADADVSVSAGARLQHEATTQLLGGGEFTGNGTLDFASTLNVLGTTTIHMTGGTVDLDGPASDLLGNTVSVHAPFTMNVGTLSAFGKNNIVGTNSILVDGTLGGTLAVNLTSPTAAWKINPSGRMTLVSGNVATTVLSGSDVDMDGQLTVMGDVRSTARMMLGGTVDIQTAGQPFRLEGGTLVNTNRLDGGAINGPGLLQTNAGHALYGFGSINSDVNFVGTAELKASDGQLTVSGNVLDVGEIGTANASGILNMANAWNTTIADQVRMAGGELQGANVTNDNVNGIRGFGRLTARVTNNSRLTADGGTLIVDNPASDYDGAGGGTLDANLGDLEVRDNATFGFTGMARVGNAHNALINGFRMNFNAGSTLQLTGGTWQAPSGTNLAGTVSVNAGSPSTMTSDADVTFINGGSTTLLENLRLDAAPAIVQAGATFTGGGDLINRESATLRLQNGAVVGVGIQNQGILEPGNSATVRADAADFVQSNMGSIRMDLAGTGINQFDRFVLSGGAQLAGELLVSLSGGFVPSLGDSFTVLTANGGVTGTFQTETLPTIGGGLGLDVVYNPTSVVLQVIQSLSPDFDMDGDADGDDVDLLVMEIAGMTNGATFDLTGDGRVDGGDLTEWLAQAGALNLPSGNSYLYGDANLDGTVDGVDFITWNTHKFTANPRWTFGDFSADGFVDGSDFIIWNTHKFMAADGASLVPEPNGMLAWLAASLLLATFKWRILGDDRSPGSVMD